jgi:hypothetical protein
MFQVLERDTYTCTIDSTGLTGPGALLDVSPVIPSLVDIRTLSRYAGLSGGVEAMYDSD